jgi:hypothetical protein
VSQNVQWAVEITEPGTELVVSLLQEDNRGANGKVAGHTHILSTVCSLLSAVCCLQPAICCMLVVSPLQGDKRGFIERMPTLPSGIFHISLLIGIQ